MTELQIGLIGLGVAAVAGVYGYNKWQEIRHRKVAEKVLHTHHDDVLLGDTAAARRSPRVAVERQEPAVEPVAAESLENRREPVLGDSEAPVPVVDEPVAVTVAMEDDAPPVIQVEMPAPELVVDGEPAEEVPAGEIPVALLDPRMDFVAVMELVDAVPAHQILHSQHKALERIAKPIQWVGFNEKTREWESMAVNPQLAYRRLRIGLQLVDRRGPLSSGDLTVFVGAVQQLADELLAVADMPEVRVLDQALALDKFCAEVDLEIGVNLVSKGTPFSGTKIRALAEAAGMILGEDGLFTRYDDEERIQFRLQNLESTLFTPDSIKGVTTHGLTFTLDVPRVDHGERVFYQMVELAKRFAETLNGSLVDDNRQPLNEAQLDHIKREFVMKAQATMAQFGIPAGSPQSLRLFS